MTNARELTARLADLLAREHAVLADFLVALADFDARRLWTELGYSSLFWFLHRELRLSKAAAQYRKTAAELVQRIPEIVAPIREGRLCLTTLVEVARVVTKENREEVLPRFFGLSRQEAMEVAAELRPDPAPPRRDVTTAVRSSPRDMFATLAQPTRTEAPACAVSPVPGLDPLPHSSGFLGDLAHANTRAESRGLMPQPQGKRVEVKPLDAELRRVHFTASRRFMKKLEAARSALSHSKPGASDEEILEAGLDLLLAHRTRERGSSRSRARSRRPRGATTSRRTSGGRSGCGTKGSASGRSMAAESAARRVVPRARGGPSTAGGTSTATAKASPADRSAAGPPEPTATQRAPRARPPRTPRLQRRRLARPRREPGERERHGAQRPRRGPRPPFFAGRPGAGPCPGRRR